MDAPILKNDENNLKKEAKPAPAKNADMGEAMRTFARLSTWIVFPVLLGALLGKWLDKKYNSDPKWFLIVIGLAFIISMAGLVKGTMKEYKKIEKDYPPKNPPVDKISNQ